MSAARALAAVAIATVASLVLALAFRDALPSQAQEAAHDANPSFGIEWDRPETLGELASEASALVHAQVEAIEPGPDDVWGESPDEVVLPTERIRLRVIKAHFRSAPERITLFSYGGGGQYVEENPAWRVGERYLLFASPRLDAEGAPAADGTWVAISPPDGRLREDSTGRVRATDKGPATSRIEGRTVPEAAREAERARAADAEGSG